jgi:hypothetical protein
MQVKKFIIRVLDVKKEVVQNKFVSGKSQRKAKNVKNNKSVNLANR